MDPTLWDNDLRTKSNSNKPPLFPNPQITFWDDDLTYLTKNNKPPLFPNPQITLWDDDLTYLTKNNKASLTVGGNNLVNKTPTSNSIKTPLQIKTPIYFIPHKSPLLQLLIKQSFKWDDKPVILSKHLCK